MEYTKSPRYLIAGKLFNLSLSNFLLVGNNDLINGCVLRYTRCIIELKLFQVLNRMYNMYAVLMNVFDWISFQKLFRVVAYVAVSSYCVC